MPGTNLHEAIVEQASSADVFIFMLSDDFMASDYCTGVELKMALERAGRGEACVVGIVTRPCVWNSTFPSELLVLPRDANPITAWRPQDKGWQNVLEGLQRLFEALAGRCKSRFCRRKRWCGQVEVLL